MTCTTAGTLVNVGFNYQLECPNIADFCNEYNKRCQDDCNGNGICLTGARCQCFYGFSGATCGTNNRGTSTSNTGTGDTGTNTGTGTGTGNGAGGSTSNGNSGTGTTTTGNSGGSDVGVTMPDTTGDDGYVAPGKSTNANILSRALAAMMLLLVIIA